MKKGSRIFHGIIVSILFGRWIPVNATTFCVFMRVCIVPTSPLYHTAEAKPRTLAIMYAWISPAISSIWQHLSGFSTDKTDPSDKGEGMILQIRWLCESGLTQSPDVTNTIIPLLGDNPSWIFEGLTS